MAKKQKKTTKKAAEVEYDLSLPQNIVGIGERVEEDKNIYIAQNVYKEIHRFTKDKTENESGGVLVGNIVEEFGKQNIIIRGFIEAKYCEGTPTTLKFTHESWDYIHKEIDKRFPKYKIVGWIHTHPDFGIFLSEYDKFIQQNFFNDENQVAYVVDPIQKIEGFYFWINGKIEKCKGFYIFDKVGTDVTVTEEKEINDSQSSTAGFSKLHTYLLYGVMAIAAILFIIVLSQNAKINKIQRQQETLTESANRSLQYMQSQITSLIAENENLNDSVLELQNMINKQQSGSTDTSEHESDPEDSTTEEPVSGEEDNSSPNDTENTTTDTENDESESGNTEPIETENTDPQEDSVEEQ